MTDENTAGSILHDAFITVFTSIGSLKDNSKLEGWVMAIVRSPSSRYLLKTEKDGTPLSSLGIEVLNEEEEKEKDIELELLLSAIELLPEGNRETFKLSVLDGLSHKEIGDLLGISPHNSSPQLAWVKKTLRVIPINYWVLFLLPALIPVYIYFVTREKSIDTPGNRPVTLDTHHNLPKRVQQKGAASQKVGQPGYSIPSNAIDNDGHILTEKTISTEEVSSQIIADSVEFGQQTVPFHMDFLQKCLATRTIGIESSMFRIPRVSEDKMMALNENVKLSIDHKKKYPWTFNFGYSSDASGNTASTLNYLSIIDYANDGAAAKIYSWKDCIDYLDRNRILMDSLENTRLHQQAVSQLISADQNVAGKVNHYRP